MSEVQSESPNPENNDSDVQIKMTPTKGTPSKRKSNVDRVRAESEEIIKAMGGTVEVEGGRRTRSSARGSVTPVKPVVTPPPAKKARVSTPSRRGRPKKGEEIEIKEVEVTEEKNEIDSNESPQIVNDKKVEENCTENTEKMETDDELKENNIEETKSSIENETQNFSNDENNGKSDDIDSVEKTSDCTDENDHKNEAGDSVTDTDGEKTIDNVNDDCQETIIDEKISSPLSVERPEKDEVAIQNESQTSNHENNSENKDDNITNNKDESSVSSVSSVTITTTITTPADENKQDLKGDEQTIQPSDNTSAVEAL